MIAPLVIAAALAASAAASERPKYIAFAWEFAGNTPQSLLELADKFDRTPLDGVGIKLKARAKVNGVMTNLRHKSFMHGPAWPKSAFKKQIPYFRKLTKHKSMRHSFVLSFACPKTRISWTDDAQWALVANNMRTVAWVAREGGFRGVAADPEDYCKIRQFDRRADDPPYNELCAIVRRRGREVFKPVFEEFPDATVHFFWFMSMVEYYSRYDRSDVVRNTRVDEHLWPAFLNGVLDVLPPGASINDGDETAYDYSAVKNGYRNGAYMFHCIYPKLVAPENIEKYRRQVRYAPPIYMDMYINQEGARWYKAPTENSRTETLRRDLVQATDVSGGYVWFWSEKHPWVDRGPKWQKPDGRISDATWENTLPGVFRMMEWVKDPVALYDREVAALAKNGALVNLAKDASVTVTNGYKTVAFDGVKGGEYYGISYSVNGDSARVNVFFKDKDNNRVKPTCNMVYTDDGRGIVRVPEESVRGVVVFSARNGDDEKTVFDDIRIYKLFEVQKKLPLQKQ